MQTIKLFLFFLFLTNDTICIPSVVFLQGTSRSGKSSIGDEIENYEMWTSIGSLYFPYCLQSFNELFPSEFARIKKGIDANNIRHAVTRNIFMFKEGMPKKLKKEIIVASQKIQNHFNNASIYAQHKAHFSHFSLNKIRAQINKGLNVLADVSWYVTKEDMQTIKPHPSIFSVLIYCPFNIIIYRFFKQNKKSIKSGNIMNYRFFAEPFKSFLSLYELSSEDSNAIDTIPKETFLKYLDIIDANLPKNSEPQDPSGFMMFELSHKELKDYRKSFLEQFKNSEMLYIVPKIKFDLLLRSDKQEPQISAKQIVDFIENQQSVVHT
jgi:hypothetical protein